MHRPQKRAVKLWLPKDSDKTDTRDDLENSKGGAGADKDGEEEDLDKLFAQYEQQAEADKRKGAEASAPKQRLTSQMGMKELRETGLSQPIAEDTRGFQLLAKMGYKAGEGIGKDRQGRAAPLSLDLKAGRTGLGVDEEKKRKQQGHKQLQELRNSKRQKGQEILKESYLTHQALSFADRKAEQRLQEAQRVCETLDRRRGMTESPMWLAEPALQDEDESEATGDAGEAPVNPWAELPVAERLGDVLQRLRNEYSYCIFCGCQYADTTELASSCPGPTEDDH